LIGSNIEPYVVLLFESSLRERGWFQSYDSIPQNGSGEPIPWYSYPCIDFLDDRLDPEFRVFEFGSGGSTQWYSNRVKEIVAVEHDSQWAIRVNDWTSSNATILQREKQDKYINAVETGEPFDIIVIDGEFRNKCAKPAISNLSDGGVIIWEDSYNEDYTDGFNILFQNGFKELPLSGMGPVTGTTQQTSIFYKEGNCLGI
jgi:hypothetical protein